MSSNPVSFARLRAGKLLDARGQVLLSGRIEASLSGTRQDDWSPTNLAIASGINVTLSADTSVTGLTGGTAGRFMTIVNRAINTNSLTLKARDPNSLAANRFGISADIVLTPGAACVLSWEASSGTDAAAWRCVGVYKQDAARPSFMVPLSADTQSTKFGSSTKLTLGRKYFDPSAARYGLSGASTATFYALMEVTSGSNSAACELYRETGTGAPTVVGTPSTTNNTTATLVSANVTSAFTSSANAGIFAARAWITTANGVDEATCSGAWIEIIP